MLIQYLQNMKNCRRFISWGATLSMVACLASCSQGVKIEGILEGAADTDVVVARLNVNRFSTLDTVKTNSLGKYTYKMKVEEGDPEFVYLYHNNQQIASLILQEGETCKVVSDTLGNYSVNGSPESEKMVEVVRKESAFMSSLGEKARRLAKVKEDSEEAGAIRQEISREYVKYYRSCVQYILANSHSLTSVNVLYQNIGGNMPVFSQLTDALHFKSISDSLKEVYPKSRYVKALADEAAKRTSYMEINSKIQNAENVGFIDLEMPDINGKHIKLSDVDAKVVMLYFWGTAPELNLFNADVIKPLYEKYHSRGFEIYAVCVDTDKAKWASVVKNQHQNWINVCDGLGTASSALAAYAVNRIPVSFLIVDGVLSSDSSIKDEASLRRFLDSKLK